MAVYIYTQNNTQNNTNNNRTTQTTTNLEECRPCPFFASFTLALALQLRKKARLRKKSVHFQKGQQKSLTSAVRGMNQIQGTETQNAANRTTKLNSRRLKVKTQISSSDRSYLTLFAPMCSILFRLTHL